MSMTNKQLKELLNQYPDETIIYVYNDNYDNSRKHILSVNIEYFGGDNYEVPDIVLN